MAKPGFMIIHSRPQNMHLIIVFILYKKDAFIYFYFYFYERITMRIVLLFKFCGYQAFYKQQTIRVFEKHFLLLLLLLNLQLSFSNVNT